jgi:hypothetical protein
MNGVLEQLEKINADRAKYFIDFQRLHDGDVLYYANACAGEMGELCNLLKKMLRGDKYDRDGVTELTPHVVMLEAADVIIYLEFICSIYATSLSGILKQKFNSTSNKLGIDIFLK